ncbi:helix-turn-helix transcriptional regulator [Nocardia nova]|uniref:winged helix-turn-helix transcriptional regulator n=1 Tax=Nocardia nova TaxID=37330 RepID=UPI001C484A5A|nr:helix-turn-helix domain-containing protein [Nocardia nova]MBV7708157.1 helix-turn-helix transcriptional regulator [Nocardia nova]
MALFIGDKWTLSVIMALSGQREARFSEIQRELDGISSKALTATLRKLEREGFVRRDTTPTVPICVEYGLTELGKSFVRDVVRPMRLWAIQMIDRIEGNRNSYDMSLT